MADPATHIYSVTIISPIPLFLALYWYNKIPKARDLTIKEIYLGMVMHTYYPST